MTQSQQNNESWTGMHDLLGISRARADAMVQAQADLLKHIEALQQTLLERAKLAAESGANIAARCAKCSNLGEAAGLYGEWLSERMQTFFADNRRFADQWLALFDAAIAPLKGAQAETTGTPVEGPAAEPVAEPAARSRAARA